MHFKKQINSQIGQLGVVFFRALLKDQDLLSSIARKSPWYRHTQ